MSFPAIRRERSIRGNVHKITGLEYSTNSLIRIPMGRDQKISDESGLEIIQTSSSNGFLNRYIHPLEEISNSTIYSTPSSGCGLSYILSDNNVYPIYGYSSYEYLNGLCSTHSGSLFRVTINFGQVFTLSEVFVDNYHSVSSGPVFTSNTLASMSAINVYCSNNINSLTDLNEIGSIIEGVELCGSGNVEPHSLIAQEEFQEIALTARSRAQFYTFDMIPSTGYTYSGINRLRFKQEIPNRHYKLLLLEETPSLVFLQETDVLNLPSIVPTNLLSDIKILKGTARLNSSILDFNDLTNQGLVRFDGFSISDFEVNFIFKNIQFGDNGFLRLKACFLNSDYHYITYNADNYKYGRFLDGTITESIEEFINSESGLSMPPNTIVTTNGTQTEENLKSLITGIPSTTYSDSSILTNKCGLDTIWIMLDFTQIYDVDNLTISSLYNIKCKFYTSNDGHNFDYITSGNILGTGLIVDLSVRARFIKIYFYESSYPNGVLVLYNLPITVKARPVIVHDNIDISLSFARREKKLKLLVKDTTWRSLIEDPIVDTKPSFFEMEWSNCSGSLVTANQFLFNGSLAPTRLDNYETRGEEHFFWMKIKGLVCWEPQTTDLKLRDPAGLQRWTYPSYPLSENNRLFYPIESISVADGSVDLSDFTLFLSVRWGQFGGSITGPELTIVASNMGLLLTFKGESVTVAHTLVLNTWYLISIVRDFDDLNVYINSILVYDGSCPTSICELSTIGGTNNVKLIADIEFLYILEEARRPEFIRNFQKSCSENLLTIDVLNTNNYNHHLEYIIDGRNIKDDIDCCFLKLSISREKHPHFSDYIRSPQAQRCLLVQQNNEISPVEIYPDQLDDRWYVLGLIIKNLKTLEPVIINIYYDGPINTVSVFPLGTFPYEDYDYKTVIEPYENRIDNEQSFLNSKNLSYPEKVLPQTIVENYWPAFTHTYNYYEGIQDKSYTLSGWNQLSLEYYGANTTGTIFSDRAVFDPSNYTDTFSIGKTYQNIIIHEGRYNSSKSNPHRISAPTGSTYILVNLQPNGTNSVFINGELRDEFPSNYEFDKFRMSGYPTFLNGMDSCIGTTSTIRLSNVIRSPAYYHLQYAALNHNLEEFVSPITEIPFEESTPFITVIINPSLVIGGTIKFTLERNEFPDFFDYCKFDNPLHEAQLSLRNMGDLQLSIDSYGVDYVNLKLTNVVVRSDFIYLNIHYDNLLVIGDMLIYGELLNPETLLDTPGVSGYAKLDIEDEAYVIYLDLLYTCVDVWDAIVPSTLNDTKLDDVYLIEDPASQKVVFSRVEHTLITAEPFYVLESSYAANKGNYLVTFEIQTTGSTLTKYAVKSFSQSGTSTFTDESGAVLLTKPTLNDIWYYGFTTTKKITGSFYYAQIVLRSRSSAPWSYTHTIGNPNYGWYSRVAYTVSDSTIINNKKVTIHSTKSFDYSNDKYTIITANDEPIVGYSLRVESVVQKTITIPLLIPDSLKEKLGIDPVCSLRFNEIEQPIFPPKIVIIDAEEKDLQNKLDNAPDFTVFIIDNNFIAPYGTVYYLRNPVTIRGKNPNGVLPYFNPLIPHLRSGDVVLDSLNINADLTCATDFLLKVIFDSTSTLYLQNCKLSIDGISKLFDIYGQYQLRIFRCEVFENDIDYHFCLNNSSGITKMEKCLLSSTLKTYLALANEVSSQIYDYVTTSTTGYGLSGLLSVYIESSFEQLTLDYGAFNPSKQWGLNKDILSVVGLTTNTDIAISIQATPRNLNIPHQFMIASEKYAFSDARFNYSADFNVIKPVYSYSLDKDFTFFILLQDLDYATSLNIFQSENISLIWINGSLRLQFGNIIVQKPCHHEEILSNIIKISYNSGNHLLMVDQPIQLSVSCVLNKSRIEVGDIRSFTVFSFIDEYISGPINVVWDYSGVIKEDEEVITGWSMNNAVTATPFGSTTTGILEDFPILLRMNQSSGINYYNFQQTLSNISDSGIPTWPSEGVLNPGIWETTGDISSSNNVLNLIGPCTASSKFIFQQEFEFKFHWRNILETVSINDSFSNTIDQLPISSLWGVSTADKIRIRITDDKLVLTKPYNLGYTMKVEMRSTYSLVGDFDISVDLISRISNSHSTEIRFEVFSVTDPNKNYSFVCTATTYAYKYNNTNTGITVDSTITNNIRLVRVGTTFYLYLNKDVISASIKTSVWTDAVYVRFILDGVTYQISGAEFADFKATVATIDWLGNQPYPIVDDSFSVSLGDIILNSDPSNQSITVQGSTHTYLFNEGWLEYSRNFVGNLRILLKNIAGESILLHESIKKGPLGLEIKVPYLSSIQSTSFEVANNTYTWPSGIPYNLGKLALMDSDGKFMNGEAIFADANSLHIYCKLPIFDPDSLNLYTIISDNSKNDNHIQWGGSASSKTVWNPTIRCNYHLQEIVDDKILDSSAYKNDSVIDSIPSIIGWELESTSLPINVRGSSSIITKNRVYILGGSTSWPTPISTVLTAPISVEGIIGNWSIAGSLPIAIRSAQTVLIGDYIYIIGGYGSSASLSTVYSAKIKSDGTIECWTQMASLPSVLYNSSSVCTKDRIYLLGGLTTSSVATVYTASILKEGKLGSWTTSTSLPAALSCSAVLKTHSRVYLIGGYTSSPTDIVYSAPINSDGTLGSWKTETPIPIARRDSSIVSVKDMLFLFGGYDSNNTVSSSVLTSSIHLDGTLDKWLYAQPLPISLLESNFIITSSKLYLLGGAINGVASNLIYSAPFEGGFNDYMEESFIETTTPEMIPEFFNAQPWKNLYDDAEPTGPGGTLVAWQTDTSLPVALRRSSTVITKNRIYLLGGYTTSQVNSVYTAPISSDGIIGTWVIGTPLPIAIDSSSVIITKNRIYLLGGWTSTASNIIYTAIVNADGTLGTWTSLGSLPGVLSNSSVVFTKNRVYLLGGYTTVDVNSVYSAPIESDGTLGTWRSEPPLPIAISASIVVRRESFIEILGGWSNGTRLKTRYRAAINDYDGSIGPWESFGCTELPMALSGSHIVSFNNMDYVVGGYSDTYSNKVYRSPYIRGNSLPCELIEDTALPSAVEPGQVIVTSSRMYVLGGRGSDGLSKSSVYYTVINGGVNDYTEKSFRNIETLDYDYPIEIIEGKPWLAPIDYDCLPNFGGSKILNWKEISKLPLPIGLAYSCSLISKGHVHLIGGATGNWAPTSAIYTANILDDDTLGNWYQNSSSLPVALSHAQIIQVKNRIYILGGLVSSAVYTTTIGSDGKFSNWETYASLPAVIAEAAVFVLYDRVYILGGYNGTNIVTSNVYSAPINPDTSLGAWVAEAPLLTAISDNQVVVTPNVIYLLGGSTSKQSSTAVSKIIWYSTINHQSKTIGPWGIYGTELPNQLRSYSSIVTKNMITLFGGFNGTARVGTVHRAVIDANGDIGQWSTSWGTEAQPNLNIADGMTTVACGSKVYIIGGSIGTSTSLKTIYTGHLSDTIIGGSIDYEDQTYQISDGHFCNGQPWRQLPNLDFTPTQELIRNTSWDTLPNNLQKSSPIIIGNNLYLFGGWNGSAAVATIYKTTLNSDGSLASWDTSTSLPVAIHSAQVIMIGRRIYILGGNNGSSTLSTTYTAMFATDGKLGPWTTELNLPGALQSSQAIITKNRVYLLGGSSNGTNYVSVVYTSVIKQDGLLSCWSTESSLPDTLSWAIASKIGESVYLLGGYNANSLTSVYKSTINEDGTLGSWTTNPSLPMNVRGSSILGPVKSSIQLLGNNQEVYHAPTSNCELGTWHKGTNLPDKLANSSVLITKKRVYLLGGFNNTNSPVNSVYTATIDLNGSLGEWNTAGSLPGTLGSSSVLLTSTRVYLLGGQNTSSTVTSTVYVALLNTDGTIGTWTTGTPLPSNLRSSSIVVLDDKVYLLGGYNTSAVSTTYSAVIGLDGVLGNWSAGSPLPINLFDAKALVAKDTVYLFGGNNGSSDINTIYKASYDSSNNIGSWTAVSTVPLAISNHSIAATKNQILLFSSSSVYSIDLLDDGSITSWNQLSSLSHGSLGSSIIITISKLYMLGGKSTSTSVPHPVVCSIDFDGGLNDYSDRNPAGITLNYTIDKPWYQQYFFNKQQQEVLDNWVLEPLSSLPDDIYAPQILMIKNKVYIFNGGSQLAPSSKIYKTSVGVNGILGNSWSSSLALSSLRETGVVITGSKLHILGGLTASKQTNGSYVFSYLSSKVTASIDSNGNLYGWTIDINHLPTPLGDFQTLVTTSHLYIFGGKTDHSSKPTLSVYSSAIDQDGNLGTWERESDLPFTKPFSKYQVVQIGAFVYLMGGWYQGWLGGVYTHQSSQIIRAEIGVGINETIGEWEVAGNLPIMPRDFSVVVTNSKLYIFDYENVYSTEITSDGSIGSWTTEPDSLLTTQGHPIITSSRLYLISDNIENDGVIVLSRRSYISFNGGLDDYAEKNNQAVHIPPIWAKESNGTPWNQQPFNYHKIVTLPEWSTGTSLLKPLYYTSLVNIKGKLILLGGSDGTNTLSSIYSADYTDFDPLDEHTDVNRSMIPLKWYEYKNSMPWVHQPNNSYTPKIPFNQIDSKWGNSNEFYSNMYIPVSDILNSEDPHTWSVSFLRKADYISNTSNLFARVSDSGSLVISILESSTSFYCKNSTTTNSLSSPYAANGDWIHVALTNSPQASKLYINGELLCSNPPITNNNNRDLLYIGPIIDSTIGSSGLFNGSFNEFRFFDTELTSDWVLLDYLTHEDIFTIYNEGILITPNWNNSSYLTISPVLDQSKVNTAYVTHRIILNSRSGMNIYDATALFTELGSNSKKLGIVCDGVEINGWIEKWDVTNKEAIIWIRIPINCADLKIYYNANQPDNFLHITQGKSLFAKTNVTDYSLFWHPSILFTVGRATVYGGMVINDFDGIDDKIEISGNHSIVGDATLEIIMRLSPNPTLPMGVFTRRSYPANTNSYGMVIGTNNFLQIWLGTDYLLSNTKINTMVDYHIILTIENNLAQLYINGLFDNSKQMPVMVSDLNWLVLGRFASTSNFKGTISAVSLLSGARTHEFVKSRYYSHLGTGFVVNSIYQLPNPINKLFTMELDSSLVTISDDTVELDLSINEQSGRNKVDLSSLLTMQPQNLSFQYINSDVLLESFRALNQSRWITPTTLPSYSSLKFQEGLTVKLESNFIVDTSVIIKSAFGIDGDFYLEISLSLIDSGLYGFNSGIKFYGGNQSFDILLMSYDDHQTYYGHFPGGTRTGPVKSIGTPTLKIARRGSMVESWISDLATSELFTYEDPEIPILYFELFTEKNVSTSILYSIKWTNLKIFAEKLVQNSNTFHDTSSLIPAEIIKWTPSEGIIRLQIPKILHDRRNKIEVYASPIPNFTITNRSTEGNLWTDTYDMNLENLTESGEPLSHNLAFMIDTPYGTGRQLSDVDSFIDLPVGNLNYFTLDLSINPQQSNIFILTSETLSLEIDSSNNLLITTPITPARYNIFSENIITVGASKTYTTITSAVAAANMGDVLLIEPGTYNENIILNKQIHIIGNTSDVVNLPITIYSITVNLDNITWLDNSEPYLLIENTSLKPPYGFFYLSLLLLTGSVGNIKVHQCTFRYNAAYTHYINLDGFSATCEFDNCSFDNWQGNLIYVVKSFTNGNLIFNECIFDEVINYTASTKTAIDNGSVFGSGYTITIGDFWYLSWWKKEVDESFPIQLNTWSTISITDSTITVNNDSRTTDKILISDLKLRGLCTYALCRVIPYAHGSTLDFRSDDMWIINPPGSSMIPKPTIVADIRIGLTYPFQESLPIIIKPLMGLTNAPLPLVSYLTPPSTFGDLSDDFFEPTNRWWQVSDIFDMKMVVTTLEHSNWFTDGDFDIQINTTDGSIEWNSHTISSNNTTSLRIRRVGTTVTTYTRTDIWTLVETFTDAGESSLTLHPGTYYDFIYTGNHTVDSFTYVRTLRAYDGTRQRPLCFHSGTLPLINASVTSSVPILELQADRKWPSIEATYPIPDFTEVITYEEIGLKMTVPAMAETLYDFPLLVRISTTAGVNDYDLTPYTNILVTDSGGNELPTERVGNNIWVRTTLHTYPTTFHLMDRTYNNPVPWTPEHITTSLWLDATTLVASDGDKIASWTDESDHNHHATQSTESYKPTYKASIINAKPVIRFNGSNMLNITNAPDTSPALTYFVVMQRADLANHAIIGNSTSSHAFLDYASWYVGAYGVPIAREINTPQIFCGQLISTAAYRWLDGTAKDTSPVSGTLHYKITYISSLGSSPSYAFSGDIAEIIVCSEQLDTTTRQQVEGYLAHKWGLQANLPADHPYKNEAPTSTIPPGNHNVWDFATMVLHLSSLRDSATGNMLTGSNYTQLPEAVSLNTASIVTTANTIPLSGNCGFTSVVKFKASALNSYHALGTWGVNGTGTMFSPMVSSTFVSAEFGASNYLCNHTLSLNTYYTLITIKTPGPINTTTTLILDGNILALTSTYTNTPNISASTFSLGGWKPDSSYRFIGEIQESWILPAKSVAYCQALYLSIEDSLITYG